MNLWKIELITLPCNKCEYYWQDLKWCTKWEKASFSDEFKDICKEKCFKKKAEEIDYEYINMCNNYRGKVYD